MVLGIAGRTAIVCASSRGLGKACARALAEAGCEVVVNGRDAKKTETAALEISGLTGAKVTPVVADVATPEGQAKLLAACPQPDILVNNAGILRDKMMVNMTMAEWDAVIKVHLTGTFCPMHHAANYWRQHAKNGGTNDARIINTTSISGLFGNPGQLNYAAAKAGIAAMTIVASRELSRLNVTCNAISPGAFTRMTENLMPKRDLKAEEDAFWIQRQAAEVFGTEENASAWLTRRHPALKKVTPLSCLGTKTGNVRVERLLTQIQQGEKRKQATDRAQRKEDHGER